MKKHRVIIAVALVALAAFMTVGCKQEDDTRTAKECMDQFAAAVNAKAWGDIKACTHSGAIWYNLYSSTAWETEFGTGNGPFTFSLSGDTATATKDSINYKFYLDEDGKDYFSISEIDNRDTGVIVFE